MVAAVSAWLMLANATFVVTARVSAGRSDRKGNIVLQQCPAEIQPPLCCAALPPSKAAPQSAYSITCYKVCPKMQACMSLQTSLLRPCSVLRKVQHCRSTAPSLRAAATRPRRAARKAVLALAASDDATADSLAAVAQLDALIDTLMAKKNPQDLAQCVAENIMSFDQRFWLRLATRSDAASDEEQRQQLSALARVVMQLVDAVVKRSNEQLSESTSLLQGILQAAADPQVGCGWHGLSERRRCICWQWLEVLTVAGATDAGAAKSCSQICPKGHNAAASECRTYKHMRSTQED